MSRRPRIYDADVAALEQRLRGLLISGSGADEREIAGYEAERERVLDLIGDQLREQRAYDARMQCLRAEVAQQPAGDDDWDGGFEAAHQAHLDALAHTDDFGEEYPISSDSPRYQDALRHGADLRETELASERRRVEDMINAPDRRNADGPEIDGAELGDRDRVLAEAPASPIGGMWFTPDESAPGGVRPLTETELREVTARVRDTQGDAVDPDAVDLDAVHRQIREVSQQLIDADYDEAPPRGYCRTGDHLVAQHEGAELEELGGVDAVDDGGDQR